MKSICFGTGMLFTIKVKITTYLLRCAKARFRSCGHLPLVCPSPSLVLKHWTLLWYLHTSRCTNFGFIQSPSTKWDGLNTFSIHLLTIVFIMVATRNTSIKITQERLSFGIGCLARFNQKKNALPMELQSPLIVGTLCSPTSV